MSAIFAQQLVQGVQGPWSLGGILVAIVVIAACVALVYVALRQFNVTIPQWLVHVFWIVVVAIVVIFAIRLVLTL